MKYICFENLDDDTQEIIVFPKTIDHDCMAEACARIKNTNFGSWERIPRIPVSAGFVTGGQCHGRSITLNLPSREEVDTEILRNQYGQ